MKIQNSSVGYKYVTMVTKSLISTTYLYPKNPTMQKSAIFTTLLILTSFLAACQQTTNQQASETPEVNQPIKDVLTPTDFATQIKGDSDIQLIDVRTPAEYAEGHIDGAINIDFLDEEVFSKGVASLDPNKPLYLYCRSGNRSGKAAKKLADMGFRELHDLEGGYMAWPQK